MLKTNLVRLRGSLAIDTLPGLLLPDFVLSVVLLSIWSTVLIWGGRAGRVAGGVLLAATALLAGLSYGTLVATGSELGWGLLWYTLTQLDEMIPVVRSELHTLDLLLFAVPLLLLLLSLVGRRPESLRARTILVLATLALVGWTLDRSSGEEPVTDTAVAQALLAPFLRFGRAEREPLDLLPPPDEIFDDWQQRRPGARRPNLIVVMMESVRASATTPYPPHLPTTPFLAEKAAQGLLVERAYCLIPHTSKSMLSIYTGHPPKLRLEKKKTWTLPGGGLPRLVGELGYRSAFFEPATERFEERRLLVEGLGFGEYHPAEDLPTGDFEKTHYFGWEDRCLVEPIVEWVGREPGRPFLLGMVNLSTHHDYVTPARWKKLHFEIADPPPKAERFQLYLNAVRYFDSTLRELFEKLESKGLLDDTVVFFLGDHGQAFGEHGKDAHLDVIWDEGLRIPLIVWGPARYLGPPRRIRGLRQSTDVYATIADILGVPGQRRRPWPVLGVSLLAPPQPARRLFFSSWYQGGDTAMIEGWTKYLYFAVPDRLASYDLHGDPGERRDRAGALAPAEKERVLDLLLGFRAGVNTWYARAEAEEIPRMRVAELPAYARKSGASLGEVLRLVGFGHPEEAWETGYFELELGFEVLATPPAGAFFELTAQGSANPFPVESVRSLHRSPPESWRAGERIRWANKIRVPQAGRHRLAVRLLDRAGGVLGSAGLGSVTIRPR